jgi:hypothetical protein
MFVDEFGVQLKQGRSDEGLVQIQDVGREKNGGGLPTPTLDPYTQAAPDKK